MVVADAKNSLQITGNGDVLEPHDGIIGADSPFSSAPSLSSLCEAPAASRDARARPVLAPQPSDRGERTQGLPPGLSGMCPTTTR